MFKPSILRHIIPVRGKYVGGHAFDVVGVDPKYGLIKNSWGPPWGDGGYAYIRIPDLKSVFADGGEACAASEKPLPIGAPK
jgi:C1A family cysteine protease